MGVRGGVDVAVCDVGNRAVPGYAATTAKGGQGKALFTVRDSDDIECVMDIFVLWNAHDDGGVRGGCRVGVGFNMDDAVIPADFTWGIISDMAVYIVGNICRVSERYDFISELICRGGRGYSFKILKSRSPTFRYFNPNSST